LHGKLSAVDRLSLKPCPCCGYRTGCSTCPVCFWTDDGQDDHDAAVVRGGPNGDLSLSTARLNFAIYGASHRRYLDVVRPPRADERP
jgi:NifB/MoaA-like Fe-S oxidoreductase